MDFPETRFFLDESLAWIFRVLLHGTREGETKKAQRKAHLSKGHAAGEAAGNAL